MLRKLGELAFFLIAGIAFFLVTCGPSRAAVPRTGVGLTVATPTPSPPSTTVGQPVTFSTLVKLKGFPLDPSQVTYVWSFGDGQTSTEASPTVTFASPYTYGATVTVTDQNNDSVTSKTATVQINSLTGITVPRPTFSPAAPFVGTPVQFSLPTTPTLNGQSDPNALTYTWAFGDTPCVTGCDSSSVSYTYPCEGAGGPCFGPGGSSAETVYVIVTVTDSTAGLSASSPTLALTVSDQGSLVLGAPSADKTDVGEGTNVYFTAPSVTLHGAPDTNGLTYTWDFGDGTSSSDASPSHTFESAGPMQVTVGVTDAAGNTGSSAPLTIQIEPPAPQQLTVSAPTASVAPDRVVRFEAPTSVTLDGAPDPNAPSYSWQLGDGPIATGPSPIHQYVATAGGTIAVFVVVTDALGNTGTSPAITIQLGKSSPQTSGGGGSGSGGGRGSGSGTGIGSGNRAGQATGAQNAQGNLASPNASTTGTAKSASKQSAASQTAIKPPTVPRLIEKAPAHTPRVHLKLTLPSTTSGVVGYLIQAPSSENRLVAPSKKPAQALLPAPRGSAAGLSGGGGTSRGSLILWLLEGLLALIIILIGAMLEIKRSSRHRADRRASVPS